MALFTRQPNHIAASNLTLKTLEWNIIFTIIGKLQHCLKKDFNYNYTEQEVKIYFKELDDNNNYSRIRKAFSAIKAKEVEFEVNVPGTNKVKKKVTSLVSGLDYIIKSEYVTFYIPKSACIYFCYIGGGYTRLQLCIAIDLSSVYSKMMYQFCCRWKDKGGYNCTIEKFREWLNITNKLKQNAHLRQKVLDVAAKELKTKADYYFTYQLLKKGNIRFTYISFKIHKNKINPQDRYLGISEKQYGYVYRFLTIFYPTIENDKAYSTIEAIIAKGNLTQSYQRFQRLEDELSNGIKTRRDVKNLLDYVILNELGGIPIKINKKSHQNGNRCETIEDLVKKCDLFSQKV
ncbi:replication initiation protein [Maribacter sp. HS]|uniref:replication initiation protein n=1 Tax=Maribacter sp. HS TaxID=3110480 RepID=UPI003A87B854